MKKNKKAIETETLILWMIALFVLVIVIISILVLRNKGVNALDYIKSIFRFR